MATDVPDLTQVTDMSDMFREDRQLSMEDFRHWDASNIQTMNRTFMSRTFVGDISS